nr:MAG TPA: hypothetical protein [Caudoviricetes sp.]
MGILILAAIVVSFVSWVYLGWMLYQEQQEERRRFTDEWRNRNERGEE